MKLLRARRIGSLLAVVLWVPLSLGAVAQANPRTPEVATGASDGVALAAQLLNEAPSAAAAIGATSQGLRARRALEKVLGAGHLSYEVLRDALKNPAFAPYVVETLVDLVHVHHIPGVDQV